VSETGAMAVRAARAFRERANGARSYPVLLLTEAGYTSRYYDPAMNSLSAAVAFASRFGLFGANARKRVSSGGSCDGPLPAGVVPCCNPLLDEPALCRIVHTHALMLFTWGASNNDPALVSQRPRQLASSDDG
jgi:hypothetical protein